MSTMLGDCVYCTIFAEDEEGMFSDLCTNDEKKLWEYGIIPYVFKNNVSEELKGFVEEAMERIAKVSIVKFVKRTDQRDYIKIVDEGRFSSYVGRGGGKQKLSVTMDKNKWPHPIGSAIHELMHALGFYHEHCRPDRGKFLKVRSSNKNYRKRSKLKTKRYGPYDPESIMHYPLSPHMTSKQKINTKIGQRERLSDGDKDALHNLYPYTLKENQTFALNMLNGTVIHSPNAEKFEFGGY